jgi:hypothetical protein
MMNSTAHGISSDELRHVRGNGPHRMGAADGMVRRPVERVTYDARRSLRRLPYPRNAPCLIRGLFTLSACSREARWSTASWRARRCCRAGSLP